MGMEAHTRTVAAQGRAMLQDALTWSHDKQDFVTLLIHDWMNGAFWPTESLKDLLESQLRELTLTQLEKGRKSPTSVQPFEALHYNFTQEEQVRISASHAAAAGLHHRPMHEPATGPLQVIGYVSADFVNHPTADLAMATILRQAETHVVYCYALTRSD